MIRCGRAVVTRPWPGTRPRRAGERRAPREVRREVATSEDAWTRILLPRGVRAVTRRAAGLLTRGSPSRRLPGRSQWCSGGGHLPLQRRDRPGLAPGSLTALRIRRPYHRPRWTSTRIALACGGRLGGRSSPSGDARPRHGARRLGSPAPQAGPHGRVRRPRDPAPPRDRPGWLAVAVGRAYAASDEWHQTFVEGRRALRRRAIDTAGATPASPPGISPRGALAMTAFASISTRSATPGRSGRPGSRTPPRCSGSTPGRCPPTASRRRPRSTPPAPATGGRCSSASRRITLPSTSGPAQR